MSYAISTCLLLTLAVALCIVSHLVSQGREEDTPSDKSRTEHKDSFPAQPESCLCAQFYSCLKGYLLLFLVRQGVIQYIVLQQESAINMLKWHKTCLRNVILQRLTL